MIRGRLQNAIHTLFARNLLLLQGDAQILIDNLLYLDEIKPQIQKIMEEITRCIWDIRNLRTNKTTRYYNPYGRKVTAEHVRTHPHVKIWAGKDEISVEPV